MNKHEIILNILYDCIMFKLNRCSHSEIIFDYIFLKSNQYSALNERLLIQTLVTSAVFVIKKTFKYIILKKKFVSN